MVTPDSPELPVVTVPEMEKRAVVLPSSPPPPPPPQLPRFMARRQRERIKKDNFRKYFIAGF
jgi:hypothetical protein